MMAVRMKSCLLTILLLNIFYSFVSSLYFHIGETEEKCFIEEIPEDTLIVGNTRVQLFDEQRNKYLPDTQDLRILVLASGPDYKPILSKEYGSKGEFSFRSQMPGEHNICLQSKSSQHPLPTGATLRIYLDIRVGERIFNYTNINPRDRLPELWLKIIELTNTVQQIQKELNYHRVAEKHFREVDHNTNMWIFWWPVVRSLYVVALITFYTNSW